MGKDNSPLALVSERSKAITHQQARSNLLDYGHELLEWRVPAVINVIDNHDPYQLKGLPTRRTTFHQ